MTPRDCVKTPAGNNNDSSTVQPCRRQVVSPWRMAPTPGRATSAALSGGSSTAGSSTTRLLSQSTMVVIDRSPPRTPERQLTPQSTVRSLRDPLPQHGHSTSHLPECSAKSSSVATHESEDAQAPVQLTPQVLTTSQVPEVQETSGEFSSLVWSPSQADMARLRRMQRSSTNILQAYAASAKRFLLRAVIAAWAGAWWRRPAAKIPSAEAASWRQCYSVFLAWSCAARLARRETWCSPVPQKRVVPCDANKSPVSPSSGRRVRLGDLAADRGAWIHTPKCVRQCQPSEADREAWNQTPSSEQEHQQAEASREVSYHTPTSARGRQPFEARCTDSLLTSSLCSDDGGCQCLSPPSHSWPSRSPTRRVKVVKDTMKMNDIEEVMMMQRCLGEWRLRARLEAQTAKHAKALSEAEIHRGTAVRTAETRTSELAAMVVEAERCLQTVQNAEARANKERERADSLAQQASELSAYQADVEQSKAERNARLVAALQRAVNTESHAEHRLRALRIAEDRVTAECRSFESLPPEQAGLGPEALCETSGCDLWAVGPGAGRDPSGPSMRPSSLGLEAWAEEGELDVESSCSTTHSLVCSAKASVGRQRCLQWVHGAVQKVLHGRSAAMLESCFLTWRRAVPVSRVHDDPGTSSQVQNAHWKVGTISRATRAALTNLNRTAEANELLHLRVCLSCWRAVAGPQAAMRRREASWAQERAATVERAAAAEHRSREEAARSAGLAKELWEARAAHVDAVRSNPPCAVEDMQRRSHELEVQLAKVQMSLSLVRERSAAQNAAYRYSRLSGTCFSAWHQLVMENAALHNCRSATRHSASACSRQLEAALDAQTYIKLHAVFCGWMQAVREERRVAILSAQHHAQLQNAVDGAVHAELDNFKSASCPEECGVHDMLQSVRAAGAVRTNRCCFAEAAARQGARCIEYLAHAGDQLLLRTVLVVWAQVGAESKYLAALVPKHQEAEALVAHRSHFGDLSIIEAGCSDSKDLHQTFWATVTNGKRWVERCTTKQTGLVLRAALMEWAHCVSEVKWTMQKQQLADMAEMQEALAASSAAQAAAEHSRHLARVAVETGVRCASRLADVCDGLWVRTALVSWARVARVKQRRHSTGLAVASMVTHLTSQLCMRTALSAWQSAQFQRVSDKVSSQDSTRCLCGEENGENSLQARRRSMATKRLHGYEAAVLLHTILTLWMQVSAVQRLQTGVGTQRNSMDSLEQYHSMLQNAILVSWWGLAPCALMSVRNRQDNCVAPLRSLRSSWRFWCELYLQNQGCMQVRLVVLAWQAIACRRRHTARAAEGAWRARWKLRVVVQLHGTLSAWRRCVLHGDLRTAEACCQMHDVANQHTVLWLAVFVWRSALCDEAGLEIKALSHSQVNWQNAARLRSVLTTWRQYAQFTATLRWRWHARGLALLRVAIGTWRLGVFELRTLPSSGYSTPRGDAPRMVISLEAFHDGAQLMSPASPHSQSGTLQRRGNSSGQLHGSSSSLHRTASQPRTPRDQAAVAAQAVAVAAAVELRRSQASGGVRAARRTGSVNCNAARESTETRKRCGSLARANSRITTNRAPSAASNGRQDVSAQSSQAAKPTNCSQSRTASVWHANGQGQLPHTRVSVQDLRRGSDASLCTPRKVPMVTVAAPANPRRSFG